MSDFSELILLIVTIFITTTASAIFTSWFLKIQERKDNKD